MNILISAFVFLFYSQLQAQSNQTIFSCSYGEDSRAFEICEAMQNNNFSKNEHAERAIDGLLEPLGLPRNFVVVSCPKISNAMAVTYDGLRYIIYDNDFMVEKPV